MFFIYTNTHNNNKNQNSTIYKQIGIVSGFFLFVVAEFFARVHSLYQRTHFVRSQDITDSEEMTKEWMNINFLHKHTKFRTFTLSIQPL